MIGGRLAAVTDLFFARSEQNGLVTVSLQCSKGLSSMRVTKIVYLCSIVIGSPVVAQVGGIHDLVKPNLDTLREVAEEERLAEEKRLQKIAEEEEAKRLEEERKQAVLDAIKADPLVDVDSLTLAGNDQGKDSYKIESGGTLGAIASDRYGSSQYFPIVEHWNGVKAEKVFVGQVIKTPSIATIMKVKGKAVRTINRVVIVGMSSILANNLSLISKLR